MAGWTSAKMPSQRGRCAVVTGTGGLGLDVAVALARAGAEVIVAGRDPARGATAIERIRREAPAAEARHEPLDLASLGSVQAFATRLRGARDDLDLLINNAGVMMPPRRETTLDGFELQVGTNHLGHVALTARLLPLLRRARAPRVVSVSSLAARGAAIDLDDLQSERAYRPMRAYGQSKLACLMFALELQRRSDAGGWGVASLAAHPGVARTDLFSNGPGRHGGAAWIRALLPVLFQPAPQGALPILFAATAPEAAPGGYYGPDGLGEARGARVASARMPPQALDRAVAAQLWDLSEHLVAVRFGEAG